MKTDLYHLFVLLCALWLPLCVDALAVNDKPQAVIVRPCPSEAIPQLPIANECVAAAVAENAFLQETKHQILQYVIVSMPHTKRLWKFVIERGDGIHPPPDGGQWMASVNRSTGKVDLTPGR